MAGSMIGNLARCREQVENEAVHQTDLRTPARLAFADQMNRFIAGDRAPSSPEGAKMLPRADPTLDRPMICSSTLLNIAPVDADNSLLEFAGREYE
jgi:hypothetical protein